MLSNEQARATTRVQLNHRLSFELAAATLRISESGVSRSREATPANKHSHLILRTHTNVTQSRRDVRFGRACSTRPVNEERARWRDGQLTAGRGGSWPRIGSLASAGVAQNGVIESRKEAES